MKKDLVLEKIKIIKKKQKILIRKRQSFLSKAEGKSSPKVKKLIAQYEDRYLDHRLKLGQEWKKLSLVLRQV